MVNAWLGLWLRHLCSCLLSGAFRKKKEVTAVSRKRATARQRVVNVYSLGGV